MFCQKCGNQNEQGAFTCIHCGMSINATEAPTQEKPAQPAKEKTTLGQEPFNLIKFCLGMFIRPVTTLKMFRHEFNSFKYPGIVLGIVSAVIMLTLLVTFIFTFGRTPIIEGGFMGIGGTTVGHEWALGEVPWLSTIIGVPLVCISIVAVLALVYFVAAKIIRKDLNFFRLVGMISGALIPFTAVFVLGSIFGIISSLLAMIVMALGMLYTYIIIIYVITTELKLEDNDTAIYFHFGALVANAVIIGIVLGLLSAILLEAIIGGGSSTSGIPGWDW